MGLSLVVLLYLGLLCNCSADNKTQSKDANTFDVENYMSFVRELFPSVRSRTFWAGTTPWTKSYDGKVYVPYYFDNNVDPRVIDNFYKFVNAFNRNSCIRWIPDANYLYRVRITGAVDDPNAWCHAVLGMFTGTYIFYKPACLALPFGLGHEMMHALGFIHEHQRNDRDCYVTLSRNPDDANYGKNFALTDESFPYDINSIMQYPGDFKSLTGGVVGPTGDMPNESDWIRLNYVYCNQPHICVLKPDVCAIAQQVLRECKARRSIW